LNTIHLAIDEPIKSTLLEQFLHKSNIEKKISTFEEIIAKNLLNIETNDLPIASILAFEKLNPDKSFFFKASPCFFSLQRDFYRFEKNFDNQLDSNTLLDLCNLLNKNFSSDSINFIIKDKFILLKANSHTAVGSFFPEQLNSIPDKNFLPYGKDAMFWHRLINEIQMCLYNADINRIRQQQKLFPINTIWFSGGGQFPENIKIHSNKKILSNSYLINQMYLIDSSLKLIFFDNNHSDESIMNADIYFDLRTNKVDQKILITFIEKFISRKKIKNLQLKIILGDYLLIAKPGWFPFLKINRHKRIFDEFVGNN
jgi:hypothetical protein